MEHRGNGNGMMTMGRNKRVGLINRFFLVPRRRANISCMLDHYNDASKEGLNDGLVETYQHGPDLVNLPHSLTDGRNIHTHTLVEIHLSLCTLCARLSTSLQPTPLMNLQKAARSGGFYSKLGRSKQKKIASNFLIICPPSWNGQRQMGF